MRKIILSLQMSLDGVVADPQNWMDMTDEIIEAGLAYYDTLDAILVGSNSYPGLSAYWQEAETNSKSEVERRFAQKINAIKKIVFSRSRVELSWRNSEQLFFEDTESLVEQITTLKHADGKDLSVESGLKSWQVFLQNDLFDELIVGIHPTVAGQGEKLFTEGQEPLKLNLTDSKLYQNGVIELHYQKA